VFEAEARAGGVLRSEADGGWLHEHAASALLSGSPDGAVAMCRELGVPLEAAAPAAKRRWIFLDGALQPLPSGPLDLLRSHLLSWRGKLRLLAEPLVSARPPSRRGDESIHDFAARRLGPEVARAIVGPFVTGIYAGDARQTSLTAGFPTLAALEEKGGLLRGALARRGGPKREKRASFAPPGGVESLTRELATRLGDRVRLSTRVLSVRARPGLEIATSRGVEHVDRAVLALPGHALPGILSELPDLAAMARTVPYAPAAIAFLGFRRADIAHPLDGFGFLVAENEPARVLGVVFESSIWSHRAPADHVLLRCIFGGTRDPAAVSLSDADLLQVARTDLSRILGISSAPVHTRIVRHPRAIPQYTLDHIKRVASATARARLHNLVLAGNAWHGIGVTDCVSDAHRVATESLR
jgi:oxygen-dependent protoporphyrinogen oxidase